MNETRKEVVERRRGDARGRAKKGRALEAGSNASPLAHPGAGGWTTPTTRHGPSRFSIGEKNLCTVSRGAARHSRARCSFRRRARGVGAAVIKFDGDDRSAPARSVADGHVAAPPHLTTETT